MKNQIDNITTLQLDDQTCPATAYQQATVCVPVVVRPFASAGIPITFCCGDPIVTPGPVSCVGTPGGACSFTITQNICVEVPVIFGARTRVGTPAVVECEDATSEDVCTDCGEVVPEGTLRTLNKCKSCK